MTEEVFTVEFIANEVSVVGRNGVVSVKLTVSVEQLREILLRIERDGR